MGAWDFGLNSVFLRDKVFSLSLMVFDERIEDLCMRCFIEGDFVFLRGVVRVGVVNPMLVFAWTILLDFSYHVAELVLGKIRQSVMF